MRMAKDIALGMNWLHQNKPPIIHRDLKPANLLVRFIRSLLCFNIYNSYQMENKNFLIFLLLESIDQTLFKGRRKLARQSE
jgi:serine/threonine protein kinase